MEILIQQDDCAPDALEVFEKDFEYLTKMTIQEFQKVAFEVPFEMGFVWSHKGYRLEWFCDDPYYTLKEVSRENS